MQMCVEEKPTGHCADGEECTGEDGVRNEFIERWGLYSCSSTLGPIYEQVVFFRMHGPSPLDVAVVS